MREPRKINRDSLIALDFSTLDRESLGSGQHRYAVALAMALARLETTDRFMLLGSQPEPPPELKEIFGNGNPRLVYRQFAHASTRGAYWIDQFRYRRFLQRNRVDLIHNLHGNVPMLARCPSVVTQYDLMYELFSEYEAATHVAEYRLNRWAVRRVARRILAISAATADDLATYWHVDRRKIDTIHLGNLMNGRGAPSRRAARPIPRVKTRGPWNILAPFNLEPRKNLEALIVAIARLRPSHPESTLTLFGRAAVTVQREAHFNRLVHEHKLEAAITLTGFVDDCELMRLYDEHDLFVFPSLYEGFGLPVLEAMAAGRPVIARNASAIAEIVGPAGILIETREPDEIAGAIARLIGDPALRDRLGRAACARAAEFTVERMAAQTYESYRRALGGE